jgi:hypothetical protein
MNVHELLARTPSSELSEWRAYEQISGPLGGVRGDVNAAMISAAIVAVNRGKGQRAPKLADFMPRWDRTPVRKSPEELFKAAMAANASLQGRVVTNN